VNESDGKVSWTILHNASAGMRGAFTSTEELRDAVQRVGLAAEVEAFERADLLIARLEELLETGAKRVAVAAGDGTVSATAARLAHTPVTLGVVPVGGANNFARSAGVPTDLDSALAALGEGATKAVSLGYVVCAGCPEGRYFTETAGTGLFADGLALYGDADEDTARTVYALTRLLVGLHATPIRLTLDGTVYEAPSVLCMIANGSRFSDSLPVAPGARLDDDVLDVVLFGDIHRRELLRYFNALRRGRHIREMDKTERWRAHRIHLETVDGSPLQIHADDTVIGTTPAVFTLHPNTLQLVVPRGKPPLRDSRIVEANTGGESLLLL